MSNEHAVPDSGIGEILISSRSLDEYRAMFALTEHDLTRRVLDCPAGTSSFTAEVNSAGGHATACDLIYATETPDELTARSLAETDRGNRYMREHPEQYRWGFFTDPDEHLTSRRRAGHRFAADRHVHPDRYVPGRLPHLPFFDGQFDLVLSSHLLFSYADRLDFDTHLAMLLELMRVTNDELRVFPLVAMGSVPYPRLDDLRLALADRDVITAVTRVDYEFQAGGDHMLVCNRRAVR